MIKDASFGDTIMIKVTWFGDTVMFEYTIIVKIQKSGIHWIKGLGI